MLVTCFSSCREGLRPEAPRLHGEPQPCEWRPLAVCSLAAMAHSWGARDFGIAGHWSRHHQHYSKKKNDMGMGQN